MTEVNPPSSTSNLRKRFSILMREHHLDLLVYARAILRDHQAAQDVVQDALVTAWRKFDDFDEKKDFGTWLRGIIRNKCKDWFRKMQRDPIPDLQLVEMEIDLTAWQSGLAAGTGIFATVEKCLHLLPDNLRESVWAFYFENQDGADAARSLNISSTNLRKRLERARGLLHDCISKKTQPQTSLANHV